MQQPSATPSSSSFDNAIQTALQAKQSAVQTTEWLTKAGLEWGGRVLAVILLLILAWVFGAWARRTVGRVLERPHVDKTLGRFLGNMIRWVIFAVAIVVCCEFFGFNITSIAALVGAAGLTIGLALQGSLANLAAGVMILILRPFKIGDSVAVAGQSGVVDDIDLFHTKIDTGDNRRLIIPNGLIFGSTIENSTHHLWRRCDVHVGVAYAADIGRTRAALLRAAESTAKRDTTRPIEVALLNLGGNAVEWAVRVWVPTADLGTCRDAMVETVKNELDRDGIAIPFAQMDVWLRNQDADAKKKPERS